MQESLEGNHMEVNMVIGKAISRLKKVGLVFFMLSFFGTNNTLVNLKYLFLYVSLLPFETRIF